MNGHNHSKNRQGWPYEENFVNIFSWRWVFCLLILSCLVMGTGKGCMDIDGIQPLPSNSKSFSVYALSRAKGVPEDARKALEEAKLLLKTAQEQGNIIRLLEQRIGLEGETRICAEFKDEETAAMLFQQIQDISHGVDLFNLTIESCPP